MTGQIREGYLAPVTRSAALWGSIFLVVGLSERVLAEPMDPALSRLRSRPHGDCEPFLDRRFCPRDDWFERLVAEFAAAMAPSVNRPARSVGMRGLRLSLDSTLTTLNSSAAHWRLGTEGEGSGTTQAENPSPNAVMIWNRAEVRKGLPFGFEIGGSLAQAIDTSMWNFGVQLQWSLFEGFYSDLGQLPDVAIAGGYNRSVGSHQLTVDLFTVDLLLSKPIVIERSFEVTPLFGVQALFVEGESGVVDLTPGGRIDPATGAAPEDAFGDCRPVPGSGIGEQPALIRCADGTELGDFVNDVTFDPVNHLRLRLALGGRVRFDLFTAGLSLMFDLTSPAVQAEGPDGASGEEVSKQVALNLSVGAIL